MTTLYAFTGKKGSGKSTAAKYVAEKTGAVRINFKDALVEEMKENFPDLLEELSYLYNPDEHGIEGLFREKPPLMRALMQNYGTEVRRGDNPNYWTQKWLYKVNQLDNVVTDDIRFLNEAKGVKFFDGVIIRIIRSDITSTKGHLSETEMDQIEADYTVEVEKGDLIGLYQQLDAIIGDAKTNP
jgi:hypothetical protein